MHNLGKGKRKPSAGNRGLCSQTEVHTTTGWSTNVSQSEGYRHLRCEKREHDLSRQIGPKHSEHLGEKRRNTPDHQSRILGSKINSARGKENKGKAG